MKRMHAAVLAASMLFGSASLMAQDKAPAPPSTVTAALDAELSHFEKAVLALAEAMPEDKYNFKPTAGKFDTVMDFAGQVKHLGGGYYFYGGAILGEKHSEDAEKNIKTKAQCIQYLKDGLAYAHKALASINDKNMFEPMPPPFGKNPTNRIALGIAMVSHPNDHYGQMVEYLRGAGYVPPGSK